MILNNYNDYLTYGGNEHEKRISTSFDSNFSTFNDCLWWQQGCRNTKRRKGRWHNLRSEAGSAGEAVAKEKGFNYNAVSSQADALMEVKSGTSDAAIIDLLMAGAMIGEGTSYPDLVHTTELTSEKYGVGCRKGSDLASYINSVFADHMLMAVRRRLQRNTEYRIHFLSRSLASSSSLKATVMWIISSHRAR